MNRSAVIYDARMKEWLAQYKYRGNERYAELLIEMLLRAFTLLHREANMHLGIGRARNASPKPWNIHAVTSVPVSDERLQERGFNQAEMLAQGLAHRVRIPCVQLLERKRHTDKQSFKNRMDRLRDMKEAFGPWQHASEGLWSICRQVGATQKKYMEGRAAVTFRILLVDDIYTTGSTIDACAQVLRRYESIVDMPIEVYSLTWARS
ncbi:ComF family protein [Paenibacillus solani]|uniref:ComF family protein n=1 Tax=Paenibacillus solani TaxID=1705565 RepID=UPI003D2C2A76